MSPPPPHSPAISRSVSVSMSLALIYTRPLWNTEDANRWDVGTSPQPLPPRLPPAACCWWLINSNTKHEAINRSHTVSGCVCVSGDNGCRVMNNEARLLYFEKPPSAHLVFLTCPRGGSSSCREAVGENSRFKTTQFSFYNFIKIINSSSFILWTIFTTSTESSTMDEMTSFWSQVKSSAV